MSLYEIQDLTPYHNTRQRIMALDLGEKTMGVALSDITWCIASPLQLIRRTNKSNDIASLVKLATEHQVISIVVGLPINMNGTLGPQAEKMKEFAEKLSESCKILIVLWDERLSTVAVSRTLLNADMTRKKRAEVVDKLAATYILQGALDRLKRLCADKN